MGLDGAFRQEQPVRDLLVGEAVRNEPSNVQLPAGQQGMRTGPVRVSSRVPASTRLTSRSSCRRPTKLVSSAGKLDGRGCRVRSPSPGHSNPAQPVGEGSYDRSRSGGSAVGPWSRPVVRRRLNAAERDERGLVDRRDGFQVFGREQRPGPVDSSMRRLSRVPLALSMTGHTQPGMRTPESATSKGAVPQTLRASVHSGPGPGSITICRRRGGLR